MVKLGRKPKKERPLGPIYLEQWLDHLGKTGPWLAKQVRVTPKTVWQWQVDPYRLDPLQLGQIARALGILTFQLWLHPKARGMRTIEGMIADGGLETAPPVPSPELSKPTQN